LIKNYKNYDVPLGELHDYVAEVIRAQSSCS